MCDIDRYPFFCLNSSRAEAHRQVHGLKSLQEAYEQMVNMSIAKLVFEACAHKGFVKVLLQDQWPTDESQLVTCTRCLNAKDCSYLEHGT